MPEYLVSDQGTTLLSSLMQEVYEITGIHKLSTTAYHPQTGGLVENFNRTLRAMVAKYAAKYGTDWDEHLPYLLFSYRTKPHESIRESPFFLLYGRDAHIPCESVLSTKRPHIKLISMITNLSSCSVLLKPGKLLEIIVKQEQPTLTMQD